ncbi:MAG: endonuclease MutS2 [Lachnospirales bacterium]
MEKKSLKVLEFTKIVELLVSKAISPMGKDYSKNIEPNIYLDEIKKNQKETTEAVNLILKRGSFPLGGIKDIRESIKRVGVGGTLSIEELLNVGDFLYVCGKVERFAKDDRDTEVYENLQDKLDSIVGNSRLENKIHKCIKNDKELNDNASDTLFSIRQSIRNYNNKIREQLNNLINSSGSKTMLQDNVITTRNGRYCVPVKFEYKNSFGGMIHDQSSTGATVFIEPTIVVESNNKISQLKSEEKAEIDKILYNLSQMVVEELPLFHNNLEMITYLDFVFAKGELSLLYNGTRPKFNTKGFIDIKKGRHPLLDKNEVVPTDIYIGKDFTTLLITGPNTGGKTVSLKTLGLFTLMGQSGLHIPAQDGSELGVFDNVFADIGDEQSIEQSLSTFSSHMTNIVYILKHMTKNSLVLFDELGAGTDPTEGAALGISILENLHKKDIRVAVTTHYSELKVYAIDTKGVENACCEFDVKTLRPTYKLLIGIPGKSNAFAISKRLGLPTEIINGAKEIISQEDTRLESVITDLEINRKTILKEKEEAENMRQEIQRLKKDVENQKNRLDRQREKAAETAKKEAKEIITEAKEKADRLIQELNRQISGKSSMKEIEKTRAELREATKKYNIDFVSMTEENKSKKLDESLKNGDNVFVTTMNSSGTIVSDVDKNKKVMVQIGSMKMQIHISNLQKEKVKKEQVRHNIAARARSGKSSNIKVELDIRGHNVEEGLEKLDKYLDDAFLANLKQVSIIHGKGTGVLRRAVHDFLKGNSNIANYRFGEFGEGDLGVTIVTLK